MTGQMATLSVHTIAAICPMSDQANNLGLDQEYKCRL